MTPNKKLRKLHLIPMKKHSLASRELGNLFKEPGLLQPVP